MKIRFFLSFFLFYGFFCEAQTSQGFFLNDWLPREAKVPPSQDTEKPEPAPDLIFRVDPLDTVARVSPFIFGNNANTWSTIMYNNPTLVNHIREMNPRVLRYPGGNLSNVFFWDLEANKKPGDMPQYVIDEHGLWEGRDPATWTMSVDNYYRFLDSVNCEGIICVNYSYARYGTSEDPVAKAAHYAADWVRYDNGKTRFWEIGNENYGNWQSGYEIDTAFNKDGQPQRINGRLYGEHCRIFIDSMKSAAAEIGHTLYIGVQAWESETSWDPVQTDWNEQMMPVIADKADFYIVHNYYTPYEEDSDAQTILQTYQKSTGFKESVFTDLAEAGYGPAPLALTEWNIFAVGSRQQVSHINGIHAVLVTGQLMEDAYGMANRWDLANGWANGDDHGTFSQGEEPGVERFEPRPVFYYLTYMQRYFGDVMVAASGEAEDVVVYASAFHNGPLGVVVVNKGTQSQQIALNSTNFMPGENYYRYTLEGGTLDGEFSRQVVINGHAPDRVAGGPSNYHSINAYSSQTNGGILFEATPYSVSYLLIEGETGSPEAVHELAFEISGIAENQDPYPLGNAVITLGSNTYMTDNRGILEASVPEGTYELTITKNGYVSHLSEIVVDASETLTYTLQEQEYNVTFLVKDQESETPLDACKITINGESKTTGSDGKVLFQALPSDLHVTFEKDHYSLAGSSDFHVVSDTLLTLYAKKNLYLVKCEVIERHVEMGIWGIRVTMGDESRVTSNLGTVYFEIPYGAYLLTMNDPAYSAVYETVEIQSDTTFRFVLEPLLADIKFRLYEGTTPVNNAQIILQTDTLYSSTLGIATFRDQATDSTYSYAVKKDGYKTLEGKLCLRKDTILDIQMEKGSAVFIRTHFSGIRIWPNPATQQVHFSGIPYLQDYSAILTDLRGSIIRKTEGVGEEINTLDIQFLDPGVYLLRIVSKEVVCSQMLMKTEN
jgi:hypothetical protein